MSILKASIKRIKTSDLQTLRTLMLIVGALFLLTEPALAQEWANKTNSVLEQIISGLKILGRSIALIAVIWIAYGLITGTKRFQDVIPFLIGAACFVAGPELVDLFF